MDDKQNPMAGETHRRKNYEKDDQANRRCPIWRHRPGGVTQAAATHAITTQKPDPQAQKVKEQEIKKTLTHGLIKTSTASTRLEGRPRDHPGTPITFKNNHAKPQAGAAKQF